MQINTQFVSAFDLWFPTQPDQRVLWPSTVRLSQEYFTSLGRWVAGPANPLRDGMLLTQDVREGTARVQLHLDPERAKGDAFAKLPSVRILRSADGQLPRAEGAVLRWTGADTLGIEVPLGAGETMVATVEIEGERPVAMPPVCLPYSPEFKPTGRESGLPTLERMARATGGVERIALAGIWGDLPRQVQMLPVARWLLLAAVVLLLFEVMDRRTSVLSNLLRRRAAAEQRRHATRSGRSR